MARDVAVIGFDGVQLASVGLFLDMFDRMGRRVAQQFSFRDDFGMQTRVKLLGQTLRPIRVAGGRKLEVDSGLDATPHLIVHMPDFDIAPDATMAHLENLRPVIDWLRVQHRMGAHLSATGRSIELLAEAGVLGQGPVPVRRSAAAAFRQRYPQIRVDSVEDIVDRGGIMMARGGAQEMTMLTRLIARHMSSAMAGSLAEAMGIETRQEGLSDDLLVASAQVRLSERASRGLRISTLATEMGVSQQTLIRRFRAALGVTPRDYLQIVRVRGAQSQLRDTARPIYQIATLAGYDDLKSFQIAFRRHSGMSPSRYRALTRSITGPIPAPNGSVTRTEMEMPLILC
jgi:transcriptional regulator GlxA family with amidase domain